MANNRQLKGPPAFIIPNPTRDPHEIVNKSGARLLGQSTINDHQDINITGGSQPSCNGGTEQVSRDD